MGPKKRINQRISKCKLKESTEDRFHDKSCVTIASIDEASNREKHRRGIFCCDDKKVSVDQISRREKFQSDYKIDHLPTSSRKSTLEGTEKKNDSICEDEIFLESQLSSQDNLLLESSQDDGLCEVRWDYSSPETMKHLKTMRGKYCIEDVKQIIANFPDMPMNQMPSRLNQIKLSILPKYDDGFAEKNKIHRAKLKAAKRWKQREKCKGAVQDMLLFLQEHQGKQGSSSTKERPLEVSFEKDSPSDEKPKTNDNLCSFGDDWSDEDLFKDDSFLIAATQNFEKLVPLMTKGQHAQHINLDIGPSKQTSDVISSSSHNLFGSTLSNSSSTNSVLNSSVIPSSYVGKDMTKPCDKNFINKIISNNGTAPSCVSKSNVNKPPFNLVSTAQGNRKYNGKCVTSVDIVKPKVTNCQNNVCVKTSTVSRNYAPAQRTAFGRHHTFQGGQVSKKQSVPSSTATVSSSPFRRVLSFDDCAVSHSRAVNSASNNTESAIGNVKAKTSSSYQNMSFDSSLTDELLMQATEDFDVVCVDSFVAQKSSDSTAGSCKTSPACDEPLCIPQQPLYSSCVSKKKATDITNTILSPVRPVLHESSLKTLHSKPINSPVQYFFKKTFAIDRNTTLKHKSETGPQASTPVKLSKTTDIIDVAQDKPKTDDAPDSFMDDDSFMNDEALFESQILPMLEMVETQVTGTNIFETSSPTKYSPDEIEKKRQAALQKLWKNGSVQSQQKNTNTDCKQSFLEQTQNTTSPRKCSQDEIDRKKRAAQRKLHSKTNSAGSIEISPGDSTQEPLNNNNPFYGVGSNVCSPERCSQDIIQMKREEAVRKRRLKLQQASNVKL